MLPFQQMKKTNNCRGRMDVIEMEHLVSTEGLNGTSSDNPCPENSETRKTFCQTTERNRSDRNYYSSCMSESAHVLSSMIDTLKELVSAFRSFQQSTDKGMAELNRFASTIIQEERQTNCLLEALLHEVTKKADTTGPSSWPSWAVRGAQPSRTSTNSSPFRPSTDSPPPRTENFLPSTAFASLKTSSSLPFLKTLTCSMPLRSSVSCGLLNTPAGSMPPAEAAASDLSAFSASHESIEDNSDQRLPETWRQESLEMLSPTVREDSIQSLPLTEVYDNSHGFSPGPEKENQSLFQTRGQDTTQSLSEHGRDKSDQEVSQGATETYDQKSSDSDRVRSGQELSYTGKEESDKVLSDTEKVESDQVLSDTRKKERSSYSDRVGSGQEMSDTGKEERDKELSDSMKMESGQRMSDTGKEENDNKELSDSERVVIDKGLSDDEKVGSDKGLTDSEKVGSSREMSDTGKEGSDKGLSGTERMGSSQNLSDTEKEESDKGLSDTERMGSSQGLSDSERVRSNQGLSDTVKEESDIELSDTESVGSSQRLSDKAKEDSDIGLSDTERMGSSRGLSDAERVGSNQMLSDTERMGSSQGLSDIGKEEPDKVLLDTGKDKRDKRLSDSERAGNSRELSTIDRAEIDKFISDTEIFESDNMLTETEKEESDVELLDVERMEHDRKLVDTGKCESGPGASESRRRKSDLTLSDTGRQEIDQEFSHSGRQAIDPGLSDMERVESDQRLSEQGRGSDDEKSTVSERRDEDEELIWTEQRENGAEISPQVTPSSPQNVTENTVFVETLPKTPAEALLENTDSLCLQDESLAEKSQTCHSITSETQETSHSCHITNQTETFEENYHILTQTEKSLESLDEGPAETSGEHSAIGLISEIEQEACSQQTPPSDHNRSDAGSDCRMPAHLHSPPSSSSQEQASAGQSPVQETSGHVQKGGKPLTTKKLMSKTRTQKEPQHTVPSTPYNRASSPAVPEPRRIAQPTDSKPVTTPDSVSHSPSLCVGNRTPTLPEHSRDAQPSDSEPANGPNGESHSLSFGTRNRTADQIQKDREFAFQLSAERKLEAGSHRLHEALVRARAPDPDPPPTARSYDTVLCLDVSDSMDEGGAFTQMMTIANDLINGIEDRAYEVEENIAVVTFGAQSNIVQHLTNDFERVRNAIDRIVIGGRSPFFEAMVVCIAAFDGKGGTVSVSGEYDVHPRIIFITDGLITECSNDPFGRDMPSNAAVTRAKFSKLMMDLSPKKNPSMPHPISFIPVGSQADQKFLKACAVLCDGQLVEPGNIMSLCSYFKVQETIGKLIVFYNTNKDEDFSDNHIQDLVMALASDHTNEDMVEIVQTVKEEMARQPAKQSHRTTDPTNFDEVFENKEGVAKSEQLPLGTRVLRGPDWSWDDQDHGGPGTVLQHEDKKYAFTWVLWDLNGRWNRYPYGPKIGYHIWRTDEHPVFMHENGELEIGMTVVKGAEWITSDLPDDSAPGVIIRKSRDGKHLKVRWQNGDITSCSVDAVVFRDPFASRSDLGKMEEEVAGRSLEEELFGHSLDYGQNEESDEDKIENVPVWQWQDDSEQWHVYKEEENDCLEKAYVKKASSCVIQRHSNIYRVNFRRMIERHVDKKVERPVQRVSIPYEDYKSLLHAEKVS